MLSYAIQGKGYPDLCSRALLRILSKTRSPSSISPAYSEPQDPAPPVYALVDSDPDGMAIMSIYKYSSAAQAHENTKLSIGDLQWLGLRTSSVVKSTDRLGEEAFLPLSIRDRKKAIAMLSSPIFAEDGPEPTWRGELQQMLMLNLKAEIEILYERDGGLEGWLDKMLLQMA
jgi:meiotic recombination protein SPO11